MVRVTCQNFTSSTTIKRTNKSPLPMTVFPSSKSTIHPIFTVLPPATVLLKPHLFGQLSYTHKTDFYMSSKGRNLMIYCVYTLHVMTVNKLLFT